MESLYRIADAWLPVYALHMVEISLFIVLILAIDRFVLLRTRLRGSLWTLALVKLFVPPVIALPASLSPTATSQFFIAPLVSVTHAAPAQPDSLPPATWLFFVWLGTVLFFLAIVIGQNSVLRLRLQSAKRIFTRSNAGFTLLPTDGLQVFTCGAIQTPVLVGFRRPRLYLPADYEEWPLDQQRSILAHEQAHIAHHDIWILGLQTLSIVLFGLNPLVWLLHSRLAYVRELRCDEAAIAQTGMRAQDYSKLLYEFVARQTRRYLPVAAVTYFSENRASLLARFRHLLSLPEQNPRPRRWHSLLAIAVSLAILPASWYHDEKIALSPSSPDQATSVESSENDNAEQVAKPSTLAETPQTKNTNTASTNYTTALQPLTDGLTIREPSTIAPSTSGDTPSFTAFDIPPQPVDGYVAIQKKLAYPEIARKAGIEGKVLLTVLIDSDGSVLEVKTLSSLGAGCDESAIAAIKAVRWSPAQKSGVPIKIWITVPVFFRLR